MMSLAVLNDPLHDVVVQHSLKALNKVSLQSLHGS